jgi:hypothetical protein
MCNGVKNENVNPHKYFFAPVIKDYIHNESFVTDAKKIFMGVFYFYILKMYWRPRSI